MPKGQQRSNKEVKKPKQPKRVPPSPFSSVMPQPRNNPPPGKTK